MQKSIFGHQELCRRLGVDERTLDEWEKAKFIRPAGVTDEGLPFYTESVIVRGERIRQLAELGYGIREIQKIVRKIGLPREAQESDGGESAHKYLTVGTLAEKVGVSPRTIKHWEEKGIIEPDMRSEGGFRFYAEVYVYLCHLVQDLQLFGYPLDQIKKISDLFRSFLAIRRNPGAGAEVAAELDVMLDEIAQLSEKMNLLKAGIGRWENLLKEKKKEIVVLRQKIEKRAIERAPGTQHA
jgi:DNA-binding transcriptional MerR regulator